MTDLLDLEPAAHQLRTLVQGVTDDQLGGPTPCPDYAVRDLLGHVLGLATAFEHAATKTGAGGPPPGGNRAVALAEDWRDRIPAQLTALVTAWRDPSAWKGHTEAGGVELPAELAGTVALNELVLHGWDLAMATGQAYQIDPRSLQASHSFVELAAKPEWAASRNGLFGEVVKVASDAPLLDRVLGLSGRDPGWTP